MIDIQNPQDLCKIIFLTAPSVPLVQISRDAGELQGTKIEGLLPRLGQAHKAAFFCARPLLVEGPSDAIMCNALDQRLSLYLNVGGSSIVPITGKGQMPVVSKLMRLAGKTPIVLADLDAVADGMDFLNTFAQLPEANEAARRCGHADLIDFARGVYQDFCHLVESHWDDIAPYARGHSYWGQQGTDNDDGIRKRRTVLATLLTTTPTVVNTWPNEFIWSGVITRLKALFDFLEASGCFIYVVARSKIIIWLQARRRTRRSQAVQVKKLLVKRSGY